jgi:hypothetical protein
MFVERTELEVLTIRKHHQLPDFGLPIRLASRACIAVVYACIIVVYGILFGLFNGFGHNQRLRLDGLDLLLGTSVCRGGIRGLDDEHDLPRLDFLGRSDVHSLAIIRSGVLHCPSERVRPVEQRNQQSAAYGEGIWHTRGLGVGLRIKQGRRGRATINKWSVSIRQKH